MNLTEQVFNFNVIRNRGCSLVDNGLYFTMDAPDGSSHDLLRSETSDARLVAHWAGFVENHGRPLMENDFVHDI